DGILTTSYDWTVTAHPHHGTIIRCINDQTNAPRAHKVQPYIHTARHAEGYPRGRNAFTTLTDHSTQ
ncbi:Hypothetical predicted protein, partial [Pelobates cultripes]